MSEPLDLDAIDASRYNITAGMVLALTAELRPAGPRSSASGASYRP